MVNLLLRFGAFLVVANRSNVCALPSPMDGSSTSAAAASSTSTVSPALAARPTLARESYVEILETMSIIGQKLDVLSNHAYSVGYNYEALGLGAVATHFEIFNDIFRQSAQDDTLKAPNVLYQDWITQTQAYCAEQVIPFPCVAQDQLGAYPQLEIEVEEGLTNNLATTTWFASLIAFQGGNDLLHLLDTHFKANPRKVVENLIMQQIVADTNGIYTTLADLNLDDYMNIVMKPMRPDGQLIEWKVKLVTLLARQ